MLKKTIFWLLVFGFQISLFAQDHHPATAEHSTEVVADSHGTAAEPVENLTPEKQEAKDQKEFIDHHLKDAHSFDIMLDKKNNKHIGFPLPVIFYDKENGFHFMMSSAFHHGEEVVESKGSFYKLYHDEKIYKTDANGTIAYDEAHHPTNEKVIDLSITKGVLSMLVVGLLMIFLFGGMARRYKNNALPTGAGRFLEPVVLFVRDDIAKPNIGPKYRKFTGYLLTAFFFILFLNILGLTPLGVNVTGNLTFTFFMALLTYIIVQVSANWDYWKHILWMPGVPVPMKIIMLPIELLGTLTKPFALMIRLFANMTAGHIVVMSLIGLIYVYKNWVAGAAFPLLTIVIYLLEVLVAFLQAYIFTMLSALFIGMAVQEHDHEHAH